MKEKIKRIAETEKISAVGFCRAADCKGNIKEGAESVIVCAFNYFINRQNGNISLYARGKDYHKVTRNKMNKIAEFLEENGYWGECFADTGELNERQLARLSGIGFCGRNQMSVNEKLGSWFFIGYVVTNCKIEPDGENTGRCIGCGKCVEACPTGALDNGFDEKKCLSYITQKRGELTEAEKAAIAAENTVWGCDVCQKVCPHNTNVRETDIEEFKTDVIDTLILRKDITNKEFLREYGDRAFAWRGKNVILRNQDIVLKNR